MDELMDFFDFSKDFERTPAPKGCVSSVIGAACEGVQDSKPIKREYKGDEYSKTIVENEKKLLIENLENPSNQENISVMDGMENLSDEVVALDTVDEVYDKYNFHLRTENNLPINVNKREIVATIRQNPITILEGDTGSGKTTQVPQFIIDDAYSRGERVNIVVTQPRRIAAISIARRVSEERHWEEGSLVGFQVGLHANASEDTRILYCTTGVLLQKLVREKSLNRYTHIILDEVHERDQDMDFVLIMVRRFLATNSRNVKIILMSATFDTNEFQEYFNIGTKLPPIVRVNNRRKYRIQTYFLNDLQRINAKNIDVDLQSPGISPEMYSIATKLIIILGNIEHNEALHSTSADDDNCILIFLPGINEIDMLYNNIMHIMELDKSVKLRPIRLHSLIPTDEQCSILKPSPKGLRKVILATNIAESSITVPGVKYVIDFCLTKVLVTDSASNFSSLQLRWASKANCKQRAGRAGRLTDGRVYRLVTETFYKVYLEEYITPEMLRCPLETVVLKAKMLDIGPPSFVLALALNPPNLSDIHNTILRLKEAGALYIHTNGKYSPDDGDLTFLGRVMAALPLDIRLSRLIMFGYILSLLDDAIIIAAGLSVRSIFQNKFRDSKLQLEAHIQRLVWADGSGSDLFAILRAYSVWVTMREQHNITENRGEGTWANHFHINLRSMKEMHLLINELQQRLKSFGITAANPYQRVHWTNREKTIIMKIIIAGAFYPNYFVRTNLSDVDHEKSIYQTIGGNDPCSTVYFTNFNQRNIGNLYTRQIKDYFKKVNIPPRNIEVRFQQGSERIFVTFKKDPGNEGQDNTEMLVVPGHVRPEVYKALALKQLQIDLRLSVMEPRSAIQYAQEQKYGMMIDGKWEPKKKPLKNIELIALPSLFQRLMRGTITHVVDCNQFYFQELKEVERIREIERILNKMDFVENYRFESPANVSKGMLLAAPYDGRYQRAKVIKVVASSSHTVQFGVFFIDYGYTANINFDDLRYFPSANSYLHEFPPRIFECRLAMVQPSSVKNPQGNWTDEAIDILKQVANSGVIEIEVYSLVGSIANVMLKIDDCSIIDILIDKGLARKSDENFMSKVDHDKRMRKQTTMSSLYSQNYAKENEDYILETLNVLDEEFDAPPSHLCHKTVILRGPFSPLTTKMYSAFRIGNWRGVKIDRDSVNSTLIDSDPQDLHERLIVAASINETVGSETLIARGTTQMPNIPGFSALVTLMFCPTMQMKRDKSKTKYISILAGLGYDTETNKSIYAEHDIVLTLDTEILTSDIEFINQFRYYVDTMLYTEPDADIPQINQNERGNLIAKIKDQIIKLFNKNRKYIAKCESIDAHEWQTPDPEDEIGTAQIYGTRAIFPMHSVGRLYDETYDRLQALSLHCKDLHQMSKLDASVQRITCQLCNQVLDNLIQLRIHLLSQLHRDREYQINFKMN